MGKKFLDTYKVPILISITLAVVIVAFTVSKVVFSILLILVGALLGTFFLDLDFFIYAFYLEPEADFSKNVAGYFKSRDIKGAFTYIHHHRDEVHEKILNSALFQVILAAVSVFVTSSSTSIFMKSLVLSAFVNSFYRLAESYFEENSLDGWFWAMKKKPTQGGVLIYLIILGIVLLYCLSLL